MLSLAWSACTFLEAEGAHSFWEQLELHVLGLQRAGREPLLSAPLNNYNCSLETFSLGLTYFQDQGRVIEGLRKTACI